MDNDGVRRRTVSSPNEPKDSAELKKTQKSVMIKHTGMSLVKTY